MDSFISKKELYTRIAQKKQYDFVAYVLTPFHLLGVRAYVEKLHDELKRNITGLIVIGNNPKGGVIIEENDIVFGEYAEVESCFFNMQCQDKVDISQFKNKKHNRRISLITPLGPWLKLSLFLKNVGYKTDLIIIDDGTATYRNKYLTAWMNSSADDFHKGFILFIIKEFITKLMLWINNLHCEHFGIFSKKSFMNDEVVSYYKRVIQYSHSDNIGQKYILYLGTSCDSEEEELRLNQLGQKIVNMLISEGYTILTKAHPRQPILFKKDSNMIELPKEKTIEEILAKGEYNVDAVIGWDSTALITLLVFYDLLCISLINYMLTPDAFILKEIYRENKDKLNGLYLLDKDADLEITNNNILELIKGNIKE